MNGFVDFGKPDDLGIQENLVEQFVEPFLERSHQIGIGAGQQAARQFDDGYLTAESCVNIAHFQADITAAHDKQLLGNLFELESPSRIHYARAFEREHRRAGRAGTGCQDAVLETLLRAVVELDGVRVSKGRPGIDILDVARFAHGEHVIGEGADDLHPMVAYAVDVNPRLVEMQAQLAGIADVGDHLGRVQKRLGGNAAHVQTRAPGPFGGIDQDDFQALVRRMKRRRIPARTGANDEEIDFR